MARPKKNDAARVEPVVEQVDVPEPEMISVDLKEFVKVRDSVLTGLASIQAAINALSTGYISHSNAFLIPHGAGVELGGHLAKLNENLLFQDASMAIPAATATAAATANGKKGKDGEKKKRQHDPNAPKRPLTPFFLYMQTARPIIAGDLGPESAKGMVSAEGTRRWTSMTAFDKEQWSFLYRDNLHAYNARMHAYKAGDVNAKDMTDDEAQDYIKVHNIPIPPIPDAKAVPVPTTETDPEHEDQAQIQAQLADSDVDAEAEPERQITPSPTPKPKTPKAKKTKATKADKKTPQVNTSVVEAEEEVVDTPAQGSSAKSEKEKSPEKKRKRSSKKEKAEEAAAAAAEEGGEEEEKMAVETPKTASKPRKRSKKAEV